MVYLNEAGQCIFELSHSMHIRSTQGVNADMFYEHSECPRVLFPLCFVPSNSMRHEANLHLRGECRLPTSTVSQYKCLSFSRPEAPHCKSFSTSTIDG